LLSRWKASTVLLGLLLFFLPEKAAGHIGGGINVHRRHADRLKADDAASIGVFSFVGDIKIFTGKAVNAICIFLVFVVHPTYTPV
jgi:hypothetical protein